MSKDQHLRYIAEAIDLAKENLRLGYGGPFGAIIVKDGQILARAVNRVIIDNDPTAHAEVVAIREACKALGSFQLDNCDLYTSCEPCPMCLGAIYWARPRAIYYAGTREDAAMAGFDDDHIYDQINLDPGKRSIPAWPLLRDKAVEVFQLWNQLDNKIPY